MKKAMQATKPASEDLRNIEGSEAFKNMVNLLAVYSEADNRMGELQTQANRGLLELMDEHKAEYAKLQETLTKAAAALEVIAQIHPEWFGERKSIKTPYGTIKFHRSTELEVPNEEVTMVLLQAEAERNRQFKLETYTRTETVPNLAALRDLDDATLAKFRINRVVNENFSVSSAKVDMGKAVKEAIAQQVAA